MKSTATDMDASVIIPVKNAEEFIELQVESLIKQETEYSYEVIVADNCSMESTCEIIKKFAEENPERSIKLVNASGFPGANYARNKAVSVSVRRFLLFCNADDAVNLKWIQHGSELLEYHPVWTGESTNIYQNFCRESKGWLG